MAKNNCLKYPLYITLTFIFVCISIINAQNNSDNKKVYIYKIHDEIAPGATRVTEQAVAEAEKMNADFIILDLNTFGGLVDDADKIRTALLETDIPTMVFIRNNAASAGALISIACDSIFMKTGSSIGAAAVVKQDGSYAEEKYQSYMRSKMRATAEATNRNPDIAEGMVNPKVVIKGLSNDDEIITLSVDEALEYGYCNAKAESIDEVLKITGLENATRIEQKISFTEKLIQFLVKPYVAGVLLMILVAGIYFELQSPGIGFPLAASVIAAILYFAPHYLEGLAANWEIALFIVGVILLIAEIFFIPGFGVAGVSGLFAIIVSLSLALINNINGFDFSFVPFDKMAGAFLMVTAIMTFGVLLLLFASGNLANTKAFKRLALDTIENKNEGFIISASKEKELIGKEGVVTMDLRPAGKIEIENEIYDAQSDAEYIEKGKKVLVKKQQGAYLMVIEKRS
ncbi:MAG: NfeD family protein [Chitinophagales bacterium]